MNLRYIFTRNQTQNQKIHIQNAIKAHHTPGLHKVYVDKSNEICDLIYRNRSKSHIGSYEIIDFKDFNTL